MSVCGCSQLSRFVPLHITSAQLAYLPFLNAFSGFPSAPKIHSTSQPILWYPHCQPHLLFRSYSLSPSVPLAITQSLAPRPRIFTTVEHHISLPCTLSFPFTRYPPSIYPLPPILRLHKGFTASTCSEVYQGALKVHFTLPTSGLVEDKGVVRRSTSSLRDRLADPSSPTRLAPSPS